MSDVSEPSLVSTIGEMARAGAGFLADLVARIVGGLQAAVIAPLFALGCQAASSDVGEKPVQAPEVVDVQPAPKVDEGPKKLGLFSITFYYVTNEEEVAAKKPKTKPANDNTDVAGSDVPGDGDEVELAAVAPPEMVTIFEKKGCEPIVDVSREFATQLKIQGTGRLRDGRILNVSGHCGCETSPCFKVIQQQWGTGGSGRALNPFRTVAVDPKLIKLGSLLYVPLLEGRTMPGRPPWGGFVHDGCVSADDVGGGIKGEQLDLFVGKKAWFHGMASSGRGGSHAWARHVPVFDGAKICERKGRKVSKKTGGV